MACSAPSYRLRQCRGGKECTCCPPALQTCPAGTARTPCGEYKETGVDENLELAVPCNVTCRPLATDRLPPPKKCVPVHNSCHVSYGYRPRKGRSGPGREGGSTGLVCGGSGLTTDLRSPVCQLRRIYSASHRVRQQCRCTECTTASRPRTHSLRGRQQAAAGGAAVSDP